ncbi:MAG: tRNA (adenosine(37)-N6)-threonylcarbamoyltransferase complex dimerization subunit type 1 TsaB [Candidatus Aminicenantales bacterium]|jgi:tRNA threonylcarbamoyladenosine biosynthesis protein TsaB
MLILAVDTTTPSGSVALLRDAELLGEFDLESPSTHSARLLRSVGFLLQANGLDIQAVDAYAVAAGPGSFTGIRIGLSAVKSLAFASGRMVAPVSTLEALASKIAAPPVRLACPVLDAKKGEIYAALFEVRASRLSEVIPQGAYDPEAFFARLPAHRVTSFIGNGLCIYRDKLLAHVRDKARFPRRSPFIAAEVGLIGHRMLLEGKGVPAGGLEPVYFRISQAEEKKTA